MPNDGKRFKIRNRSEADGKWESVGKINEPVQLDIRVVLLTRWPTFFTFMKLILKVSCVSPLLLRVSQTISVKNYTVPL